MFCSSTITKFFRRLISTKLSTLGVATALGFAFWPTAMIPPRRWYFEAHYSFDVLVYVFFAYLLWPRSEALASTDARQNGHLVRIDQWSKWFVPLILFLGLLNNYFLFLDNFFVNWLIGVVLLPFLAAFPLMAVGQVVWRWSWPAVAFVVLMIPLTSQIERNLAAPQQRYANKAGTYALQTIGFSAAYEKHGIRMGSTLLEVGESHSGLGTLIFIIAISIGIATVNRGIWYEKTIIILSALPVALLVKVARLIIIGILHVVGNDFANIIFFDLAGWLMMPLAMLLYWLELKLLRWLVQDSSFPSVNYEILADLGLTEKRINRKAALILSLSICAAVSMSYIAYLAQDRSNALTINQQSKQFERQGKIEAAVASLSEYVDLEPDDIEAKVRLGRLLSNHNENRAITVFTDILAIDPEQDEARLELARLAFLMKKYGDTRTHLTYLLNKTPNDAVLLAMRARSALADNQLKDASVWYPVALKANPIDYELWLEYASK